MVKADPDTARGAYLHVVPCLYKVSHQGEQVPFLSRVVHHQHTTPYIVAPPHIVPHLSINKSTGGPYPQDGAGGQASVSAPRQHPPVIPKSKRKASDPYIKNYAQRRHTGPVSRGLSGRNPCINTYTSYTGVYIVVCRYSCAVGTVLF